MDTMDRAAEWRRLLEMYRQMSDEELSHIAEEAYQLTDIAKQTLQAEVANRRLEVQLQLTPPDPESADDAYAVSDAVEDPDALAGEQFNPDELGLVVFRRVWDMDEAQKTKTILNNAGIACFLGDDNIEDLQDYRGSFEGGVDLKVCEADVQLGHSAINRDWPEPTAEEKAEDEILEQTEFDISCPKCHQTEIVFDGRDGNETGNDAFHAKFKWHCPACGHAWIDDGIEQPV